MWHVASQGEQPNSKENKDSPSPEDVLPVAFHLVFLLHLNIVPKVWEPHWLMTKQ